MAAVGLVIGWVLVLVVGFTWVFAESARPAETVVQSWESTPAVFPATTAVTRPAGRWMAVISLHPMCPCSKASVHELERILAETGGRLEARVLMCLTAGSTGDWKDSTLTSGLSGIAGVTVSLDEDGAESARFGATVSGHTVLFDPAGKRVFAGGITASRGQEGDNLGHDIIVANVNGAGPARMPHGTPVYGCSLANPERATSSIGDGEEK